MPHPPTTPWALPPDVPWPRFLRLLRHTDPPRGWLEAAAELPELDKLAGRLAAQGIPVKIVAISVDEQERDYTRWLTNRELNQLIIGRDPALAREAKVTGIPSTWVLGPGGVVLAFHQGYIPGDIDKLEEELLSAAQSR